jgi:hypothetical protein
MPTGTAAGAATLREPSGRIPVHDAPDAGSTGTTGLVSAPVMPGALAVGAVEEVGAVVAGALVVGSAAEASCGGTRGAGAVVVCGAAVAAASDSPAASGPATACSAPSPAGAS